MDENPQAVVSGTHKALRCSPFVVVALCFFLPFFSVSSCGTADQTVVTDMGIQVVAGADPGVDSWGEPSGPTAPSWPRRRRSRRRLAPGRARR